MKFADAKIDPFISIEAPRVIQTVPVARPRIASEYDEILRHMTQPRSEIFSLLMLLEPPRWMAGLWGTTEEGGWRDSRSGMFLSFNDARKLIADRIKELDLSSELVNAHPSSQRSAVEDRIFWRAPFDERMQKFRNI